LVPQFGEQRLDQIARAETGRHFSACSTNHSQRQMRTKTKQVTPKDLQMISHVMCTALNIDMQDDDIVLCIGADGGVGCPLGDRSCWHG
jgi:hypothetical protein